MKTSNRYRFSKKHLAILIFTCLLVFGVVLGCRCAAVHRDTFERLAANTNTQHEKEIFDAYSAFLFEYLLYLAAAYIFGLTFLGVAAVPALVCIKGITIGVCSFRMFCSHNFGECLLEWLLSYPAAFCILALLFFSAHAFRTSLCTCKQLYSRKSDTLQLKRYTLFFILALFTIAVSGVLCCVLHLTATFLL